MWHTYPPVEMPSVEGTVSALTRPETWHVAQSYRVAGRAAQHAFWGQGDVTRLSMLHQLALQIR
jgi:hypothetical protein